MPRVLLSVSIAFACLATWNSAPAVFAQGKWDSAMQAFEKRDAERPFPKQGTVFVGSSSIRLWNLEKSFPNSGYLNRGFGGSEIADSIEFLDLLVLKHEPRVVVMYAGDNDIAKGKSPEEVAGDFETFASRLHAKLPHTKVYYIAIKPSLKRWNLFPQGSAANEQIRKHCESDPRLEFVDIAAPMLGDDGKPRPELFVEDGLHLSPVGYELWNSIVARHLKNAHCRD